MKLSTKNLTKKYRLAILFDSSNVNANNYNAVITDLETFLKSKDTNSLIHENHKIIEQELNQKLSKKCKGSSKTGSLLILHIILSHIKPMGPSEKKYHDIKGDKLDTNTVLKELDIYIRSTYSKSCLGMLLLSVQNDGSITQSYDISNIQQTSKNSESIYQNS